MQKGQTILWVVVGVLVIATIAGGAYYLGKYASPKHTPAPVITSQTPQPTSVTNPSVASPAPTGLGETVNWKTYRNDKYGFEFKYPQEYILETVDTATNPNCNYLTNTQSSCLVMLSLKASNIDYVPKAYFYFLKDINSIKISGQVDGTIFDPQKKVWIYYDYCNTYGCPKKILSILSHTKSDQEIIKSSSGGSHSQSSYYIISDYQKDMISIFVIPQAYRLRCDVINDSFKQTQCDDFYNSIIQKYNGGQATIDTWLPGNYIKELYKDTETMVKSFNFL